jgi:hypothetical protein
MSWKINKVGRLRTSDQIVDDQGRLVADVYPVEGEPALTASRSRIVEKAAELFVAASQLVDDVRGRHPGEELRCPYVRALDDLVKYVRHGAAERRRLTRSHILDNYLLPWRAAGLLVGRVEFHPPPAGALDAGRMIFRNVVAPEPVMSAFVGCYDSPRTDEPIHLQPAGGGKALFVARPLLETRSSLTKANDFRIYTEMTWRLGGPPTRDGVPLE